MIDNLFRQSAADGLNNTGNELSLQDPWIMFLDAPSNVAEAYNEIVLGGASYSFPAIGDSHPNNTSLRAVNITIEHLDSQQTKFLVNVSYSNNRETIDNNSNSNPLDLPAAYSFDQVDMTVPVVIDAVTGDPIENSAGKPFSDTLVENKPLTRITVVRNERDFSTKAAEEIKNTVNEATTRIDSDTYEAGQLKMESITASKQFDQQDRTYYSVTYKILVKRDGFVRKVIDAGNINILGNGPSDAVRLNSSGMAYLDGEGKFLPPAEPIVELEFNTLELSQWQGLRL